MTFDDFGTGKFGWIEHVVVLSEQYASSRRTKYRHYVEVVNIFRQFGGTFAVLDSVLISDTYLQPLGRAITQYVAAICYVLDVPASGQLRKLGRDIAADAGLTRFRRDLSLRAPDLIDTQISLAFGVVENGSLTFLQKIAIVVGIVGGTTTFMANAPTALKNYQEIYGPATARAVEVAADYMIEYFSKLDDVLAVAAIPHHPTPDLPVDRLPPSDRNRRRLRGGQA